MWPCSPRTYVGGDMTALLFGSTEWNVLSPQQNTFVSSLLARPHACFQPAARSRTCSGSWSCTGVYTLPPQLTLGMTQRKFLPQQYQSPRSSWTHTYTS